MLFKRLYVQKQGWLGVQSRAIESCRSSNKHCRNGELLHQWRLHSGNALEAVIWIGCKWRTIAPNCFERCFWQNCFIGSN